MLKATHILILFLLVLFASCESTPKKIDKEIDKDYILITEDGISVEKFDSTHVDQNRFTKNNTTFKEGTIFTYDFEHITSTNDTLFFTWDEAVEDWKFAWKFVPIDSIDKNTINKVSITVKAGLEPMIQHIPDYNQTIIQYSYLTQNGIAPFNGASGVIENEANIWMHPPRNKYFRILELNPFPYIKAPYKVGNLWDWTLVIGDGWGDDRWKVWEGQIENQYNYKITDKRKIKTALGKIDCFVIESTAKSRIGETKLTSYFNSEYGFVKLNYINIDGSRTNLKLIQHLGKENDQ
ncbi:hypothetical protein [Rasiella sp. SM2506]|uniref:hypothetical protein n=1 Tax=Rasiella sp. SM2506 TaxID=3423914 RepID=UPI003D7BE83D